jgi:acyl-CoA thioester hydrolase
VTGSAEVQPNREWLDGGSIEAPLRLYDTTVAPDWVDYNGHMSESCYLLVAGNSSDQFFRYIGIDEDYRAAGHSLYTVETHIHFIREASLGEPLHLTLQVLGLDSKRVHITHEIFRGKPENADSLELLATVEQMLLHVDSIQAKVTALPDDLCERISLIAAAHDHLGVPSYVGHVMAIPSS